MIQKRLREIYVRSADPYERGVQHGSQVKKEITGAVAGYQKAFEAKGYSWEEARAMAMEFVPYLEEKLPDLMQEARGIADGSGAGLDTVMVLNTRYELLKFQKGQDLFENNECTCFITAKEATAAHETIGGQNWDNAPFIGENLYILHMDEGNGMKSVGLTEPAQLVRSGMNSCGISVNCSTLLSTYDRRGVCIPTNFMRRWILQSRTFEEACEKVRQLEPTVSINYVIASSDGRGMIFETTPKETYPIKLCSGIATQGNDIVVNPLIDRFHPADSRHAHHFRGQRLNYLLQKKCGEITPEYIQDCLRDHYGGPGSICNHDADRNVVTIASILYCLDRGYALIAWGNPCEIAYEQYDL